MRSWQTEAVVLHDKFKDNCINTWDEAMQFLLDYQSEVEDLGIVDNDIVNELVIEEAKEWGWERVACLIAEVIHSLNQDFYRLDGYGNLDVIAYSDISNWLSDIANN